MLARASQGWGRAEYITQPPRWLKYGLLICAAIATIDDGNIIVQHGWEAGQDWFLLQMILSYLAVGLALVSARLSVILLAVVMALTYTTHRALFVVVALSITMLVVSALCRRRLGITIHVVSLIWAALVALQGEDYLIPKMRPSVFWWLTTGVLVVSTLIGLALRFLVVRTADAHQRLHEAETKAAQIRQEERQDLARELHDVVAHHITVITMQVMSQRHCHDPQQLRETLGVIEDAAREALSELRALLDVLHSDEDNTPRPLSSHVSAGPSIQERVERHVESLTGLGFQVNTAVDPNIESLPLSIRTTLARVMQESVTNIIKHAHRGATCQISLSLHPTEMELRITNDRPHTAPRSETTGYGLTSLKERVLAVNGHYSAGLDGEHWVVQIRLPVHRNHRPRSMTPPAPTPDTHQQ